MPSLMPVLSDDGYTAMPRDLAVAGVDDDAIRAMQARTAPLGFTPADWENCVAELRAALTASGLDDADVRIRGSSTRFFSDNPDKRFPQSEAAYLDAARVVGLSEDEARERWRRLGFASGGTLPTRHFFDSRYHLGLDIPRSDYDIQLSSDKMATRMERYRVQYPNRPVVSTHGGHYKHEHVVINFPVLRRWANKWSGVTGRDINIAAFSRMGPGGASSFKTEDWIMITQIGGEE